MKRIITLEGLGYIFASNTVTDQRATSLRIAETTGGVLPYFSSCFGERMSFHVDTSCEMSQEEHTVCKFG